MQESTPQVAEAQSGDGGKLALSSSPLSTAVETNAGSRRWSIDQRSTPGRNSVTSHLLRLFTSATRGASDHYNEDQTTQDLRDELKSLRGEYEKVMKQILAANREMRIKDHQLDSLSHTNDYCQRLLERNSRLELEVAQIQDTYEARLRDLEQHHAEVARQNEEIVGELRQGMGSKMESVNQLEVELENVKKDSKSSKLLKDTYDKVVADLGNDLKNSRDQLRNMQSELEHTRAKIIEYDQVKKDAQKLKSDYKTQLQNISHTSSQIKSVLDENQSIVTKNDSLVEELKTLRHQLEEREADLGKIRRELELKGEIEAELKATTERHQKFKQELQTLLLNENQKLFNLRQSNTQLMTENKYMSTTILKLEMENKSLVERIKNYDLMKRNFEDLLKTNTILEESRAAIASNYEHQLDSYRERVKTLQQRQRQPPLGGEPPTQGEGGDRGVAGAPPSSSSSSAIANANAASQNLIDQMISTIQTNIVDALKLEHRNELKQLQTKYELMLSQLRLDPQQQPDPKLSSASPSSLTSSPLPGGGVGRVRSSPSINAPINASVREGDLALKREYEKNMKELRDEHKRALAELEGSHTRQMRAYHDEVNEKTQLILADMESQHQNRIDDLKKEVKGVNEKCELTVRTLRNDFDHKMQEAAKEMDALLRAKDQEISHLRGEVAAAKVNDQSLRRLREVEVRLKELELEKSALINEHKRSVEAMQNLMDEQIVVRDETIRKMQIIIDDTPSASRIHQDLKLILTESTSPLLRTEISRLRDDLKAATQEMQNYREKAEDEINSLKIQLDEKNTQISEFNAQLKMSTSSIMAPSVDDIVKRNEELEKEMSTMNEIHTSKIQQTLRDIEALKKEQQAALKTTKLHLVEVDSDESLATIQKLHNRINDLEAQLNKQILTSKKQEALRGKRRGLNGSRLSGGRLSGGRLSGGGEEASEEGDSASNEVDDVTRKKLVAIWEEMKESLAKLNQSILDYANAGGEEEREKKLNKRLDLLKLEVVLADMEKKTAKQTEAINTLEEQLATARANAVTLKFAGPSAVVVPTQPEEDARRLRVEHERLRTHMAEVERKLIERETLIKEQLSVYSSQASQLEQANEALKKMLSKNTSLQQDLSGAFGLHREEAGVGGGVGAEGGKDQSYKSELNRFDKIDHLLSQLDSDMISKHESYTLELQRLQSSKMEELTTLKRESQELEKKLEDSQEKKLRLLREQHALSMRDRETLIRDLERTKRDMQRDLDEIKSRYQKSREEGEQTLRSVTSTYEEKISEQENLVAEIQREKNYQIDLIESNLRASLAAQESLLHELQDVRGLFREKETRLQNLNKAIAEVTDNAALAANSAADSDSVRRLEQKIRRLIENYKIASAEMMNMKQYFAGLVSRQQQELTLSQAQQQQLQALQQTTGGQEASGLGGGVGEEVGEGVVEDVQAVKTSLDKIKARYAALETQTNARFSEWTAHESDVQARLQAVFDKLNRSKDLTQTAADRSSSLFNFVDRVRTMVRSSISRTSTTETVIDALDSPALLSKRPLPNEEASAKRIRM